MPQALPADKYSDSTRDEEVFVPMRDGVHLSTDVLRPKGATGKLPTILIRTPYNGENGIDGWMLPFFGASVYDDPAVYAKSSPINFIKQVRTPTLLVVGEGDVECPPPQSFEYWHALKSFGIKTQLVIYPHEGHQFSDPTHALDVLERMLGWFDTNMPPESSH